MLGDQFSVPGVRPALPDSVRCCSSGNPAALLAVPLLPHCDAAVRDTARGQELGGKWGGYGRAVCVLHTEGYSGECDMPKKE